jgi:CheY-like chemotaxis protein
VSNDRPSAADVAPPAPPALDELLAPGQVAAVLDAVGEGVAVFGDAGRSLWSNRRMRQWPDEVRGEVRKVCGDAFKHFARLPVASKRYHLEERGQYLEVSVTAARDADGVCRQVVAVVLDATGPRRLQQKIDAIDKAGSELVKIESESVAAMSPAERLKVLEEKVVRVTRDLMHFEHFNVRLLDPRTNKLELVVASGLPADALDVELFGESEANGISGYVARTGRSYICPDVSRDPRYVPGLREPGSSLTVPLTLDDSIIGVLNVESGRLAAFDEDDRQFAEIFGRYVAIALSILKLLVTERAATNKKVADDVAGEVVGPLNDIALDVGMLHEDLADDAAARQRLESISSNVDAIRHSIRDASKGPQVVLGTRDLSQPNEPRAKGEEPLRGARVLVVDDEPTIREVIARVLTKLGAVTRSEATGRAAQAALVEDDATFDVVLSDIRMPDGTGYDVFAAVRALPDPPPVILMTGFGYDPNHCIVRASQEGLQAVLFKPFRVERMLEEVRTAVASRANSTRS